MKKILFFFFLIRVLAIFIVANYFEPKDYEYGEIARNLVTGNGFSRSLDTGGRLHLTSSHAPVYPFFLAFFYRFGRFPITYFLIQFFQTIMGTLTILFFIKTAELIYDKNVARLGGWLLGLYPPFIYHCTKLSPTIIFLFFLSLTVYLFLKATNGKFIVALGICLGLTVLTDPIAFVLYPIILIWLVFKKINFPQFIIVSVISILTISPWMLRNVLVHKRIVPVTTQFGVNFWIGNNPNATGTDFYKITSPDDYILMTHSLPLGIQDSLKKLSEIERADFYLTEGLKFIKNNPFQFLQLLIKKFYYYWWFIPSAEYLSTDRERYKLLLIISYVPVLFFGIVGILLSLILFKKNSLPFLLILFISWLYIFAHVGLLRYRMPAEMYLVLYSAVALNFFLKIGVKRLGFYKLKNSYQRHF